MKNYSKKDLSRSLNHKLIRNILFEKFNSFIFVLVLAGKHNHLLDVLGAITKGGSARTMKERQSPVKHLSKLL